MPLTETRTVLHQTSHVISIFRQQMIDPLPNHLHHSLLPTPTGVRTGSISGFGELSVDFRTGQLHFAKFDDTTLKIDIRGHTQRSLFDALAVKLQEINLSVDVVEGELETEVYTFDVDNAALLADMFSQMQTALARTKAHFIGGQMPLVLWSHGFDLSSIWFPMGSSMNEENDPHMNIGFSPGTEAVPEPYVYFYVYPVQDPIRENLPPNAIWQADWSTPGGMIPYSTLATSSDAIGTVSDALLSVYELAYGLLKT